MKKRVVAVLAFAGLAVFGGTLVNAQDGDKTVRSIAGDKWVITAEAGGVNYVEGYVSVLRPNGKSGRLLKGDTVGVGERVSTDATGRVEILLNPGSYVRVAGDSEFEFKTTSLEDLELKLNRGSAIFEVFATNDFRVSVQSPKGDAKLIESGVYRVDVLADGTTRLEVWKGKAEVGDNVVKGGRASVSAGGDATVAKFDREEKDAFELWSRSRAKELAKANGDLKDRDMRAALMRSYLGGGWNTYNSFGLWVYNPRIGRYCFLPFGWGWYSPYGYGFGTDIWRYRLPHVVFMPPRPQVGTPRPPVAGNPGGDGDVGRGRVPGSRPSPNLDGAPTSRRPPFAAVQGRRGMGERPIVDMGTGPRHGGGFPVSRPGGDASAPMPRPRVEPPSSSGPTRGMGPIHRTRDPID